MLLMIDNYDSFVYNLYQYFLMLGEEIEVYRNDQISLQQIEKLSPEAIIVSPGPCSPSEAGISVELIQKFYKQLPLLGVCLGHQSLGQAFGGTIVRAPKLMHGKTSILEHNGENLFKGIAPDCSVMRYHSLVIDPKTLPKEFEVTARSKDDQQIMGIAHKELKIAGIQFHPESILTPDGMQMLKNFLSWIRN